VNPGKMATLALKCSQLPSPLPRTDARIVISAEKSPTATLPPGAAASSGQIDRFIDELSKLWTVEKSLVRLTIRRGDKCCWDGLLGLYLVLNIHID
jgi:hypothetical protein